MASPSTAKLLLLRRLSRALKSLESPSLSCIKRSSAYSPACFLEASKRALDHPVSPCSRSFCSPPTSLKDEGPATIDYRSLLQEDEFHKLADSTIQDLLEKLEEYGDSTDIDGFDIDYGNHVLTLKLGTLGTYVLNKQTPNRQIWLSSPVSFLLQWTIQVRLGSRCSGLDLPKDQSATIAASRKGIETSVWSTDQSLLINHGSSLFGPVLITC
ncbi:frataxin, mitochondrial isoform X1 [Diospyros lotus]|uniref:frataxin, mitochondrial isoform X1 n=1 Tax=Diospyros lotus TaxID=55363 RepID=UPI0022582E77|nr:frataxin, mitochondrial isoform X1 [Diospyros lotus]